MELTVRTVLGIMLLLTVLIADLAGQDAPLKPVVKIEILKTKRTNPEMIKRKMRTKEGEPLVKEQLIEDLHRIYEMGFFKDTAV